MAAALCVCVLSKTKAVSSCQSVFPPTAHKRFLLLLIRSFVFDSVPFAINVQLFFFCFSTVKVIRTETDVRNKTKTILLRKKAYSSFNRQKKSRKDFFPVLIGRKKVSNEMEFLKNHHNPIAPSYFIRLSDHINVPSLN